MPIAPRNRAAVPTIQPYADFELKLTRTDAAMVLGVTVPTIRKILKSARDHGIGSPFLPGSAIREYTTPADLNKFMKRCAARSGILPKKIQRRYAPVALPHEKAT